MGRSDQEKAREKDFNGLGRSDNASCAEARKHVYASNNMRGASKHMCMNNHNMYNVDPRVSSQHYTDAFAAVKSNVLDAVHRPTDSRWLYDNSLTNSPANRNLAFAAMRRPDWSNAGGRQQFLSFNSSQEQRLVKKVNDAYQMIQGRGHENAVLSSTALNCNFPEHSGSGMKVFPFVAPVLHEQAFTVRAHQIPTASDRALTPLLFAGGTSTRMPPDDSSIKPSSTQLTIFYAGKVNIYDEVSSMKAQEIMLMAAASNSLPPKMDMFSRKSIPMVMPPVPRSLINVDPPELSQIDLPTCQSEQLARDRVDTGLSPTSIPHAPQAEESSMPSTQSAYLDDKPAVPRALPQARKASLARFLEKRKERMLSKSPYPVERTFL